MVEKTVKLAKLEFGVQLLWCGSAQKASPGGSCHRRKAVTDEGKNRDRFH